MVDQLESAGSGSTFDLSWDKATVPLEAVERALYALADQLTGAVVDEGASWCLTAHPREPHADVAALGHRLRQEVNDQTLRVRIAERTDPVRNLVFALAFSRSGLIEGNPEA
jgi:His-Xaa-Ser system protein HxsD